MAEEPKQSGDNRKMALDHAWAWFSLHSTQRLQAVNFFLVAMAFLSAAYVTAAKEKLHALAIGVAALAMVVSFLFYRVERRIRSLIHAAEAAMKPLQSELAKSLENEALNLSQRVEELKAGEWKYSKVFKYLYVTTGASFSLGLLYATWTAFSTAPGAPAFNLAVAAMLAIFLVVCGYEMLVERLHSSSDRASNFARWLQIVLGGVCVLVGVGIACHLVLTRL
jgi:hypothetical protein